MLSSPSSSLKDAHYLSIDTHDNDSLNIARLPLQSLDNQPSILLSSHRLFRSMAMNTTANNKLQISVSSVPGKGHHRKSFTSLNKASVEYSKSATHSPSPLRTRRFNTARNFSDLKQYDFQHDEFSPMHPVTNNELFVILHLHNTALSPTQYHKSTISPNPSLAHYRSSIAQLHHHSLSTSSNNSLIRSPLSTTTHNHSSSVFQFNIDEIIYNIRSTVINRLPRTDFSISVKEELYQHIAKRYGLTSLSKGGIGELFIANSIPAAIEKSIDNIKSADQCIDKSIDNSIETPLADHSTSFKSSPSLPIPTLYSTRPCSAPASSTISNAHDESQIVGPFALKSCYGNSLDDAESMINELAINIYITSLITDNDTSLQHPAHDHLLPLLDHSLLIDDERDESANYMLFPLCRSSLAEEIKKKRSQLTSTEQLLKPTIYDWYQLQQICKQLLITVDYLHTHSLVHCDITPSNILINNCETNGNNNKNDNTEISIKLVDFGLAFAKNELTQLQSGYFGSPLYFPPEQLIGRAEINSDIWNIIMTLITFITGLTPFQTYLLVNNKKLKNNNIDENNQTLQHANMHSRVDNNETKCYQETLSYNKNNENSENNENQNNYSTCDTNQPNRTNTDILIVETINKMSFDDQKYWLSEINTFHKLLTNSSKLEFFNELYGINWCPIEFIDLIEQALIYHPKQRSDIKQLLAHPFLQSKFV